MDFKSVSKLCTELGCDLSVESVNNRRNEIICDAPDNYVFSDGHCLQLISGYYPKEDDDFKSACKDVYDRLKCGLEPITEIG